MRACVIGAGVVGLACATALAEGGFAVEIFERAPEADTGNASLMAGGMLAPWCEGETAEEPVVRLGLEAAGWWAERVPGVARAGTLVVAAPRDRAELQRFARRTSHHQWFDDDAIAALEPDLAGHFRRALFFAGEAHLDPRRALTALRDRLRGLGARFHFGTAYERGADEGLVIDCRGWAAQDALPDLRGIKGEMVMLRAPDIALHRPVRFAHPRLPLYVVPRGEGVFMVGATMIESADERVTARGIAGLINSAYALHPAFGEAEILEVGAGVRPAFADNLPRIRRRGNTLYVNGVHRHGFLLAPALARMAARAAGAPEYVPEVMDENHRERQSA